MHIQANTLKVYQTSGNNILINVNSKSMLNLGHDPVFIYRGGAYKYVSHRFHLFGKCTIKATRIDIMPQEIGVK